MRLLIISHDVVGTTMAGPGIRYWELAQALAAHAAVTLLAPRPVDIAAPGVTTASYTWGDAASLTPHLERADVALVNSHLFAAHPELAQAGPALIVDLYDPTPLENLELLRSAELPARQERSRRDVELLGAQLAAGDFFLCATERQRDMYIGALLAAGRVTPERTDADPLLRGLIDVVPFGLPADPPAPGGPAMRGVIPGIGAGDPIILWSGGLWDWMDPQTLITAMPALLEEVPNARLVFLAGRHPGPAAAMRTPDAARALAAQLGLLDRHVFFYEQWVPYQRRADFLLEATVVVSLHRQHLETAYAAVRSRFLDHLWAGRASLVSAGDAAAELVERHRLGRVAPIGDAPAVARLLGELLSNQDERSACASNARALAVAFVWEKVSAPVRRFCAAPQRTRPAPQPSQPPAPRAAMDTAMNDQTRNETVGRLDDLWKIQTQPLSSGLPIVGQAKEMANSLTRWYVQAIVDQQNAFNAGVVQAIQALAASDDQRHTELTMHIHALHNHLNQTRHTMATVQRMAEQLASRLDEQARHLSDIDDAETSLAAAVSELRELAALIGQGGDAA